jgi:hypothetical protein
MSLYPTAPLSIGKVLDGGFTMYRSIIKRILPLSFGVAFLAQVPQVAPYLAGRDMGATIVASLVVGFLVWYVLYMALYAGWLKSMDSLARGGEALGTSAAFSAGLPKVLPITGATILFILALMVGFVLLIIPGLILMLSLLFFWFLIVLEDKGAVESLKTSHRLVWGNWWRTATILTVGGVVYMVAVLLVLGVTGVILGVSAFGGPTPEQAAAGPTTAVLIVVAMQVVVNAVLLPMMNSLLLVLFRDLQLRKSGADLAARAAAA